MSFDIQGFLESERRATDLALERALEGVDDELPPWATPIVRAAVLSGGKRIRPILCVEAARVVGGGDGEGVREVAAALEFVHAYSLIHDDLPCMDDAPLRRGRPTPHTIHGPYRAAAAGAVLIPIAGLVALRGARRARVQAEVGARILRELMTASGFEGMVGGQALDLAGEGVELDLERLDGVHRRKTGALLVASLVIGGLVGGAETGALDSLASFGAHLGLAFQISDDVLDATSSAEALGKEPSDATLNKSTYPALLGLDASRARAESLITEGLGALASAGLHSEALTALARYVVQRDR